MEELIPFIQQQHSLGVSDTDIKNILKVRGGWEDGEVEQAYAMAFPTVTPVPPVFSDEDPVIETSKYMNTPPVENSTVSTEILSPENQMGQKTQIGFTPVSTAQMPLVESLNETESLAPVSIVEDNYNPFTLDETPTQIPPVIEQVNREPVMVSGANMFSQKMTDIKMAEPINQMLEHSEGMQAVTNTMSFQDLQPKSIDSFIPENNTPKVETFIPDQIINEKPQSNGGIDISNFPTPRVKSNSIYGGGSLNINKTEIQSTSPLATVTMGNMMNTAPAVSMIPPVNVENNLNTPTSPQPVMRPSVEYVEPTRPSYAQSGINLASSVPTSISNTIQNPYSMSTHTDKITANDGTISNQKSNLTLDGLSHKRTVLSSILTVIFLTFISVAGYMFFTSPMGAPLLVEIKSKVGSILNENGITIFNTNQSNVEPIGNTDNKVNAKFEIPLGAVSYKYSIKGKANVASIPKEVLPYMAYLGLVENGDLTMSEEGVSVQTPKTNSQKDIEMEIAIGEKNKKFHIKTPKQMFFIERQLPINDNASISYENQKLVLTEKIAGLLGAKDQEVPQVSRFGSNSIELVLQNIALLKPELIKKVEDNNNKGEIHYLVDYINFKDPEMVKLLKFIGKNINDKKTLFEELDINIEVKNIDIAIDSKTGMISSMIGTMNYAINDKDVTLFEITDADITYTLKSHTSDATLITIEENELNQNVLNISGNWAKGAEKPMYTNPSKEWLDRVQITLNANIKEEILRIRSDAITFKKKTGTYKGICEDTEGSVSMGIAELLNKTKVLCYSSDKDFAVSAQLKDETYFCAGNKEKGKILNGVIDHEVCEAAIVEGAVEAGN